MTRRTLWLSLAGVLVALAGTQPAFSFDYKIHPGSLCQPERGDQAVNFNRKDGFIFHTNGFATYGVTCPIIRDRVPHFGRKDELTRIDAGIHFSFPIFQETSTKCQWVSMDEDGRQIAQLDPSTRIIPRPGTLSMFWDVPPDKTAIDGSYSIECELPGYVFILRYVVGEDGSTDDGGF